MRRWLLAGALLGFCDQWSPLAIGSIKANCGHAEPAAGATGLLRLVMGLADFQAPPNAQLHVLNPHLHGALDGVTCAIPAQLSSLPQP